ncbi:unnamed protein product, partial [Pleuronectes platessa]
ILSELLQRENRVLHFWTLKKRRLDQCQQYLMFQSHTQQALDWLQQSGDHYLTTHTSPGTNMSETQELLNQHREFCVSAKDHFCQHTQEKVHLLIQLAESMLAKGHAHRAELRRCVSTVDKRYRDFTVRLGQYRHLLETALGGCSQDNKDLELELIPNSLSDSDPEVNLSDPSPGQRREEALRTQEGTERVYVRDLQECIETYLWEMTSGSEDVPPGLTNRDDTVFGSIQDIYEFHNRYAQLYCRLYCNTSTTVPNIQDIYEFHNRYAQLYCRLYCNTSTTVPNIQDIYEFHNRSLIIRLYCMRYQRKRYDTFRIYEFPQYIIYCELYCSQYYGTHPGLYEFTQADRFHMYVTYCRNKPDSSLLIQQQGAGFFEESRETLSDPSAVALIQQFMSTSPAAARGERSEVQGELLLQDSFLVWEPKSLIRKGRDRHLFLFELSLIFSKEIQDSSGRIKYLYKAD